jgi:hypothetical protein
MKWKEQRMRTYGAGSVPKGDGDQRSFAFLLCSQSPIAVIILVDLKVIKSLSNIFFCNFAAEFLRPFYKILALGFKQDRAFS